jgi:hypothetical protein
MHSHRSLQAKNTLNNRIDSLAGYVNEGILTHSNLNHTLSVKTDKIGYSDLTNKNYSVSSNEIISK